MLMKRLHRSSLFATFVAISCAIGAPYIVKAENMQDFGVSKTTISRNNDLLAQAAGTKAKKAAVKPPKVNVDKSGVILKGYDPVAYFEEHRPVQGDPKFSSTYRTATYHFASAAHKKAFDKSPAKYAPQYGGFCAESMSRGKLADIDPNVFFVYKGKLYVCSTPKGGKIFYSNPDVHIQKADKNWQMYEPPYNPGFNRELGS
jgi:YHS domain-containing protein